MERESAQCMRGWYFEHTAEHRKTLFLVQPQNESVQTETREGVNRNGLCKVKEIRMLQKTKLCECPLSWDIGARSWSLWMFNQLRHPLPGPFPIPHSHCSDSVAWSEEHWDWTEKWGPLGSKSSPTSQSKGPSIWGGSCQLRTCFLSTSPYSYVFSYFFPWGPHVLSSGIIIFCCKPEPVLKMETYWDGPSPAQGKEGLIRNLCRSWDCLANEWELHFLKYKAQICFLLYVSNAEFIYISFFVFNFIC